MIFNERTNTASIVPRAFAYPEDADFRVCGEVCFVCYVECHVQDGVARGEAHVRDAGRAVVLHGLRLV